MIYDVIVDRDGDHGYFVWVAEILKDAWGCSFETGYRSQKKTAFDEARRMAKLLGWRVKWQTAQDRSIKKDLRNQENILQGMRYDNCNNYMQ